MVPPRSKGSPHRRVGPEEQIAERFAHSIGKPSSPPMLLTVVQHVAALAERAKISGAVVAGIVIEMSGRQKDFGRSQSGIARNRFGKPRYRPTSIITPYLRVLIPPAAVTAMKDQLPMRAAALLATPLGALKPYGGGDLWPIDRVKPAILAADRHRQIMNIAASNRCGSARP